MSEQFTPSELAVIAGALDFMAAESTLADRRPVLAPYTADLSAAPLRKLADRARKPAREFDIIPDAR